MQTFIPAETNSVRAKFPLKTGKCSRSVPIPNTPSGGSGRKFSTTYSGYKNNIEKRFLAIFPWENCEKTLCFEVFWVKNLNAKKLRYEQLPALIFARSSWSGTPFPFRLDGLRTWLRHELNRTTFVTKRFAHFSRQIFCVLI